MAAQKGKQELFRPHMHWNKPRIGETVQKVLIVVFDQALCNSCVSSMPSLVFLVIQALAKEENAYKCKLSRSKWICDVPCGGLCLSLQNTNVCSPCPPTMVKLGMPSLLKQRKDGQNERAFNCGLKASVWCKAGTVTMSPPPALVVVHRVEEDGYGMNKCCSRGP